MAVKHTTETKTQGCGAVKYCSAPAPGHSQGSVKTLCLSPPETKRLLASAPAPAPGPSQGSDKNYLSLSLSHKKQKDYWDGFTF